MSAEAGAGDVGELVVRPYSSGVRLHKTRIGTEGGTGSREDGPGVLGVLIQLLGTGARVGGRGGKGPGLESKWGGQGCP